MTPRDFEKFNIEQRRSDELGSGMNWKKDHTFQTLQYSSIDSQNGLAFLGEIGKASLSEFHEIYKFKIQPITFFKTCLSLSKNLDPLVLRMS